MPVPKGTRIGGRQKGTKNKSSEAVRQSILNVFDKLGGDKFLLEWAAKNPTEFFKIYAKMLPKDVHLDGTMRLEDIIGGDDDTNT